MRGPIKVLKGLFWGLRGLIWGLESLILGLRALILGLRGLIRDQRGLIWAYIGLILGLRSLVGGFGEGDGQKETGENCHMWNHRSSAPPGPLPKRRIVGCKKEPNMTKHALGLSQWNDPSYFTAMVKMKEISSQVLHYVNVAFSTSASGRVGFKTGDDFYTLNKVLSLLLVFLD